MEFSLKFECRTPFFFDRTKGKIENTYKNWEGKRIIMHYWLVNRFHVSYESYRTQFEKLQNDDYRQEYDQLVEFCFVQGKRGKPTNEIVTRWQKFVLEKDNDLLQSFAEYLVSEFETSKKVSI